MTKTIISDNVYCIHFAAPASDARKRRFDVLLVWKHDRFSRSLGDLLQFAGCEQGRDSGLGRSQPRRSAGARRFFYDRTQEETDATAALLRRLTGRSHIVVTKAVNQARRFGEGKT